MKLFPGIPFLCIPALAVTLLSPGGPESAWAAPAWEPSPPFMGTSLPTPPQQTAPWTPPTTHLSPALLSVVSTLFQQGLADPRGCEYDAIRVGTGNPWSGDSGVMTVHGWVLPPQSGQTSRFAACWNGLVYPVVSVGDRADLRVDVQALLEADKVQRTAWIKNESYGPFHRWNEDATPEGAAVSEKTFYPLKVCLLLRLGEAGLAEQYWAAESEPAAAGAKPQDPYLSLASDWAWTLYDRTLCAHMRGDDHLALLSARFLTKIQASIEAEAAQRHFPRQPYDDSAHKGQFPPYLSFLQSLPGLLADQERRAKEGPHEEVLPANLGRYPNKADRIAALIRDLDEVSARQDGQPGSVNLSQDPIALALVKEGEDAVDPLINTFETDHRLTRSVGFGRSFHRGRATLSVAQAAFETIVDIVHTSSFRSTRSLDYSGDRKAMAAALRLYWNQNKGVPLPERWYRTLSDDKASPDAWMQAAGNIVEAADISHQGQWTVEPQRNPGEVPPMKGEVLRGKTAPSVAQLMARRARTLATGGTPGSSDVMYAIGNACNMALLLSKWDVKAAVPTLRDMTTAAARPLGYGSNSDFLGPRIAPMTIARFDAGDRTALADYAAWVRLTKPGEYFGFIPDIFEPLWRYKGETVIAQVADEMFNSPKGNWNPTLQKQELEGPSATGNIITSPLAGTAALQKQLLRELDDRSTAGVAFIRETGSTSVTFDSVKGVSVHYVIQTSDLSVQDPLAPKPGVTLPFRVCDVYALQLSGLDGAPPFQTYWPEAERDRVIGILRTYLQRYGSHLTHESRWKDLSDDFPEPKAHLTFPMLQYTLPTPADVQAGRAIFSSEGEGQRRLPTMPAFPLKAQWIALKKYPYRQDWWKEDGTHGTRTQYHQDGVVWQAEEVLKAGRWQRFYGFVGSHEIARVPAADIEFPAEESYLWAPLSNGLDCRVDAPGISRNGEKVVLSDLTGANALIITAWLRNRSGESMPAATEFIQQATMHKPLHLNGFRVHLFYSPPATAAMQRSYLAETNRAWTELTPSPAEPITSTAAPRMLAPTEECLAFSLDLRDLFPTLAAGSYKLQLEWTGGAVGIPVGKSWELPFELPQAVGTGTVPPTA